MLGWSGQLSKSFIYTQNGSCSETKYHYRSPGDHSRLKLVCSSEHLLLKCQCPATGSRSSLALVWWCEEDCGRGFTFFFLSCSESCPLPVVLPWLSGLVRLFLFGKNAWFLFQSLYSVLFYPFRLIFQLQWLTENQCSGNIRFRFLSSQWWPKATYIIFHSILSPQTTLWGELGYKCVTSVLKVRRLPGLGNGCGNPVRVKPVRQVWPEGDNTRHSLVLGSTAALTGDMCL